MAFEKTLKEYNEAVVNSDLFEMTEVKVLSDFKLEIVFSEEILPNWKLE